MTNTNSNETLYGIATRNVIGFGKAGQATIPTGTIVKVTEVGWCGGQYRVSAHGVRTLPLTWGQMLDSVDPA